MPPSKLPNLYSDPASAQVVIGALKVTKVLLFTIMFGVDAGIIFILFHNSSFVRRTAPLFQPPFFSAPQIVSLMLCSRTDYQEMRSQLPIAHSAMVCSVAGLITKSRVLQSQQHVPSLAKCAKAFCTWHLHFLGLRALRGVDAASHPRRHGGASLASGGSFRMSAIRRSIALRVVSQFAYQALLCE